MNEYFMQTLTEKHAASLKQRFLDLKMVQNYNKTKASPSYKAKKYVGRGIILAGAGAYGAHELFKTPEPEAPQIPMSARRY